MKKVDIYLLKNTFFVFLLANIIALIFRGRDLFPWANAIALAFCLLLFFLIRLTVRRYAAVFRKNREAVKDLLGEYIEDDRRGKLSFYDYMKKRHTGSAAAAKDLEERKLT